MSKRQATSSESDLSSSGDELIEVQSKASSERVVKMNRITMSGQRIKTEEDHKENSKELRANLAKVWCESEPRTRLCCNAFLIFQHQYIRRHSRLRIDVENRIVRLWNRMTRDQRLPFETEAFVAKFICGGNNDEDLETQAEQYFKHLTKTKLN